MRGFWMIVAAALALLPVMASAAGPMTVETFLAKAKALQASGPLALMSSDLSLLREELKADSAAYRAQVDSDSAAGKRPRACLPPKGQGSLSSTAVLADFEKIPPAKRGVSVKTAFFAMMDRQYPCK